MQRYTLVEYETASADVRALYDDFLASTGAKRVPIWVKSMGHDSGLLRAYWARTKGSLVEGNLPQVLKELVIFAVSVENGSRYCAACHAHAVLRLDESLVYEDLLSLTEAATLEKLPAPFSSAIRFAARTARAANDIGDEDFEQLAAAGFTPAEIRELLGVIDLAVMFNVYTSAARLPLDPEYRPVLAD